MIAQHMDYLPKEIAKPPVYLVLKRSDFEKERILLWALGLNPADITETHAVVLYGRLRKLGPVISGEDVNEQVLTNFLSVIGADCECGLDQGLIYVNLLTNLEKIGDYCLNIAEAVAGKK